MKPPRVSIRHLKLDDFRNYKSLALDFDASSVVLTGENGAGKTNLLEAISFLTPGRGLRRATLAEVTRAGSGGRFAVHARIEGPEGAVEIGTGAGVTDGIQETQRRVRINGANHRAETMLEWLRVIWITPAMDGLFTGPAGDRRRFLDRLVLAIDPGHGRRAADYEKAMRSRNRLLAEKSNDNAWFSAIESQMAETATAMAAARMEFVRLLEGKLKNAPSPFPASELGLAGTVEDLVEKHPAVDVEESFRHRLAEMRHRDRAAGRTLEGPHRSEILITHLAKGMPAALCSTGEQKALLIGIILAHAQLTGELVGMAPILLLDEIVAHLDAARREALFGIISDLNCQAFATGTDSRLFDEFRPSARFYHVEEGQILRDKGD